MSTLKTAASLMIAAATLIGCGDSEEKKPAPAAPTPAKTEGAMDKMGDMANTAKEKVKDAAIATENKAAELKDATAAKATEVKDATAAKATEMKDAATAVGADAKASIVETAQKYYDQAKGYLASNNLTSANDVIMKLDGIRSQLPAEWQTKVDELKAMYDKAKAGVGNMMPKMNN